MQRPLGLRWWPPSPMGHCRGWKSRMVDDRATPRLAEEALQLDALIRSSVAILDDDWSIQRQLPTLPGRVRNRAGAGNDNGFFGNRQWATIRRGIDLFAHQ